VCIINDCLIVGAIFNILDLEPFGSMTWMSTTIAPMSGQSVLMAVHLIEQHSVDMGYFPRGPVYPSLYCISAGIGKSGVDGELGYDL
jgi:hypothetical protein